MTFIIIVLILLIFLYYENNKIDISNYKITSNKIKNEDLKILHLSDLHCKSFGKNQKYLIKKIKNLNPDIIVFTGDLISRKVDKEKYINSYLLLEELSKTFPIYFTTGNHEYKSKALKEVQEKLTSFGVHVLINNYEKFTIKNTEIFIFGFDDTSNFNESFNKTFNTLDNIKDKLKSSQLNILLCHRPNFFKKQSSYGFDLIFSGHAHGGQFRIPFTDQGILMPDQGFFPKLTEGIHKDKNSTLIISRGLGNSGFPFRLFNHPEIVVVTLNNRTKLKKS